MGIITSWEVKVIPLALRAGVDVCAAANKSNAPISEKQIFDVGMKLGSDLLNDSSGSKERYKVWLS
jgi:hypothetical protein